MAVKVLYTDVDGTLVGPLGHFFSTGDRRPTVEPAQALLDARTGGLEIVPLSGRSRASMIELARFIGAETWIGELGAIRSYDRGAEVVFDQGEFPGEGPAIIELQEVASRLIEQHPGRLEEHAPWNAGRETSFMVRGELDVGEVDRQLAADGRPWAECIDNGVIPRSYDSLPGLSTVRVYHLNPRGVSKRAAIAADRVHRGLAREECAVIGDAHSDLECAPEVARAFVVANALRKDPEMGPALDQVPNAEVTPRDHGLGFADAVRTLLEG